MGFLRMRERIKLLASKIQPEPDIKLVEGLALFFALAAWFLDWTSVQRSVQSISNLRSALESLQGFKAHMEL
jgi:hypothetical protein